MDPKAEEDLIEAELRGSQGIEACLQYYPFCSDLYQLWTIEIGSWFFIIWKNIKLQ